MREIVLDTETTGLDPRTGHRLIEIACVELEDFLPTGRTFHRYVHPDRPIDPDAERVHGISLGFLADKPRFHETHVCDAFLEFIGDAALVAHNAGFDRGFVNAELERANRTITHGDRWVDTLSLAQKRFPGMYKRDKHGALIDAQLLAAVYLELRGGKERGLDLGPKTAAVAAAVAASRAEYGPRPRLLAPRSTDAERAAHAAFIQRALKDKAVWLSFDSEAS
jgi:DNA polymerase III subunit epsilon